MAGLLPESRRIVAGEGKVVCIRVVLDVILRVFLELEAFVSGGAWKLSFVSVPIMFEFVLFALRLSPL